MPEPKPVTPRRTMQQIKHCVEEALAAYEAQEDPAHVLADLQQAGELINTVVHTIESGARFVR